MHKTKLTKFTRFFSDLAIKSAEPDGRSKRAYRPNFKLGAIIMTFLPSGPFGTGGNVTATTSTTVADSGAKNFANSPNSDGKHGTAKFLLTLNKLRIGTTPPATSSLPTFKG
jgi:hypothetical protein